MQIQASEEQLIITGQSQQPLEVVPGTTHLLHRDVLPPFLELKEDAREAGFELMIASSYRDFFRQCVIWNAKAAGDKPVLNDSGIPICRDDHNDWQWAQAILRWSALPGASRHHWGTDLDVYDGAAVPADYKVQLTAAETENDGVFANFHRWLTSHIEQGTARGFFRPYAVDCGGIGCEAWHISYAPVANRFQASLTIDVLEQLINNSNLLLADTVLAHLDEIYHRFVCVAEP